MRESATARSQKRRMVVVAERDTTGGGTITQRAEYTRGPMNRAIAALALTLLAAASTLPAADAPPIRPEAIAAHIAFLSDDLLEGRETGTRGYDIAARYSAAQFAAAGLTPMGDDGTYFQKVALRSSSLDAAGSSFTVIDGERNTKYAHRQDVLIAASRVNRLTNVEGDVVFVGFGVVAPELHRDDYAGVDVRGKVVMIMSGAPASFPSNPRAYYSSGAVKARIAADHGAIGIIGVRSIVDEQRQPFARILKQRDEAGMTYVDANGNPAEVVPEIRGSVRVSWAVAETLFARAPMKLMDALAAAATAPHPFALATRVNIATSTKLGEASSVNVVAALRGSDPARASEYLVYTAHLDHLGIDPAATGDRVYNGALDNASGIACLIEIAKLFASQPKAPARSILFVALTAEEKGEQGSIAFADRPPVPRAQLVADINMDMFMMLYPVKDLIALGAEQSTLGEPAARAIAAAGFTLSPDPQPEEVRFIRSDQYSFVKRGIPAIHLKAGLQSTDASIDAPKLAREWLRDVYHSPRDEMRPTLDFASGARYAWANYLLGLDVANAAARPRWTPDDFFTKLFAK